jgi:DNA repair protein RadC
MGIKTLPYTARPRERLAQYGASRLSILELLAIILGSGTKSRSVLQLAADILSHFGSLKAISEASLQELRQVKGVGPAKAVQLLAAFALYGRIENSSLQPSVETAKEVYQLVYHDLACQKQEMVMVVMSDAKKKLIHKEIVAQGTLSEVLIHPREIFHAAIRYRAHAIILIHNHPSGDPNPSVKDIEVTQGLVAAGQLMGIELLDHLIVSEKSYFSFREKGVMQEI